jgi:hypothetical protein
LLTLGGDHLVIEIGSAVRDFRNALPGGLETPPHLFGEKWRRYSRQNPMRNSAVERECVDLSRTLVVPDLRCGI